MEEGKLKKQEHEWRGTWNRPMKLDEASLDPFTVARMTDHNVRGSDEEAEVPEGENKTEPDLKKAA